MQTPMNSDSIILAIDVFNMLLLSFALLLILLERPTQSASRLTWIFGKPEWKTRSTKERTKHMIEQTITNEQKIKATLAPVTLAGKPAQLDPNNPPKWSVISGNSTVEPAEDGMSAELISSDTPGDTDFLVEADADLGEGVETISDIIRLTVAGARAASLGFQLGEPEAK
jgi:hypothetical protein